MTLTPNELNALAECPFCGGRAQLEHLENGQWSPGCIEAGGESCVAFQMLSSYPTQREAAEAWNRRAISRDVVMTQLLETLAWYGEQARLARFIHSEGDPGRHALADDGGKRAHAASLLTGEAK